MKLGFFAAASPGENRSVLLADTLKKYLDLGATVSVESGIGQSVCLDSAYKEAGAKVVSASDLVKGSDCIFRLSCPSLSEISELPKGCIHVSFMDPFQQGDVVEAFAKQGVTAISLEMIPRTTLAQKMDVLSSQASLSGYSAVVLAADYLDKIFPMMMTPAGTLSPAKVFVIGAGVAGLQAIATAKRMGARVEAFDTRPVVAEQVESLGAKFVKVDLGDMGETKQGYAKALTDEQLKKQQEVMAKHCAMADIVITTAQLFGRPAPRIITSEMLKAMSPGSVVVDLAVSSGGNVEGSVADEVVDVDGVSVMGLSNMPGKVARSASEMLSSNFFNLVFHLWNSESGKIDLDFEDEIVAGCVITHDGAIVHEQIRAHLKGGA